MSNNFIYNTPGRASYYGAYRTRLFADIFPDLTTFVTEYMASPLSKVFSNNQINTSISELYYMLYARYGNSHIAFSDENQFKYSLYTVLYTYGPTWVKKLETQKKLREMTDTQIMLGGKAIYNHAYNPNTEPTTATLTELTHINDQNTTNYQKSMLEGYSTLLELLEDRFTEEFIDKFKKLFRKVVAPDFDLLYITQEENIPI